MSSQNRANKRKTKSNSSNRTPLLFDSQNYLFLGIGLLMVIAGFTAMYLENEVKGIISLYVSPILIVSGYCVVLWAILKKSNLDEDDSQTATE